MTDRGLINEQKYKTGFQQRLLTHFIHKFESSKAFIQHESVKLKPRISFRNGPFQDEYEDEMDFRKREWIHEVLEALAEQGIVKIRWEKFQEGRQLAMVYLEPDRLEAAYELTGLIPRDKKMERLSTILQTLVDHPWEWVAKWSREAVQSLRERRSSGLDLDDPEGYERMTEVLHVLPMLEDDIPKRMLSQQLFQDTKTFERMVERRLIHLIQSRSGIEYDSDTDALESVGIADHSRSVWIAGTLRLSIENETTSIAMFPGGIGLSQDTVRRLNVEEIGGERIVLIENLTSWHQWVKTRQGVEELVIYTGGFPNRTAQLLLRKLGGYIYVDDYEDGSGNGDAPMYRDGEGSVSCEKLPVYHWGDMDAGGIKIFEYIRKHFFPDLRPLGMDEASYLRYVDTGLEFSPAYRNKLKDMLVSDTFTRWHGLLELMLAHGKRIEQESMMIPIDSLG